MEQQGSVRDGCQLHDVEWSLLSGEDEIAAREKWSESCEAEGG